MNDIMQAIENWVETYYGGMSSELKSDLKATLKKPIERYGSKKYRAGLECGEPMECAWCGLTVYGKVRHESCLRSMARSIDEEKLIRRFI